MYKDSSTSFPQRVTSLPLKRSSMETGASLDKNVHRAIFRTLNVVSGEWYEGKILEKIPSVPLNCLNKTYPSSNLRSNLVPTEKFNSSKYFLMPDEKTIIPFF